MTPDDRKYAATHEWVKIDGDTAVVGISDHAQEALGDITFFDPPAVGDSVTKGGECGVIESVKAASDIYAPIGGTIAAVNESLDDSPEKVNNDPYEEGWLFKLSGVNAAELEDLLSAADYDAQQE